MVDCGAHHPLAALPLSRLEPSETIRDHQRPSETIRGHQRPSGTIRDHQLHSVALGRTQRHSGALRGTPRHSAATLSCLSSYETLMSSSRISRELGLISCACTSAAHASRGLPRPTCACHPMSVDNQCHGQAKASHGKEWHSPDPSGSMPWHAARRAAPLATPRRSSGAPS